MDQIDKFFMSFEDNGVGGNPNYFRSEYLPFSVALGIVWLLMWTVP